MLIDQCEIKSNTKRYKHISVIQNRIKVFYSNYNFHMENIEHELNTSSIQIYR